MLAAQYNKQVGVQSTNRLNLKEGIEKYMRVAIIGFDQSMLDQRFAKASDTRERHIKYARTLRNHYPNGSIVIILRVPPGHSAQQVEIEDGLIIQPVPSRRSVFAIRAIITLERAFRRQSFDIVTTQTPFDDGFVGVYLKWRFLVPFNVQLHSSFFDIPEWISERPFVYRVFNVLGKWVIHRADTIRVVSRVEKKRLEQRFHKLNGKIACLHPFINAHIFNEPLGNEELEQVRVTLSRRRIDGGSFLLYVGRLVIEKNLPILIKAFALVSERMPKSLLVLAGDGPLRGELTEIAKRLKIDDRILWLGNLPLQSLRAWYATACATVMPSFHEGLNKVIVESYLMGTPVISTPFDSALELIRDGETGFIAPDFTNHVSLAEKALELLANPKGAKEMGQRGKEHVRDYLIPENRYLDQLIDIWRETVERGRPATKQRENNENVQDSWSR